MTMPLTQLKEMIPRKLNRVPAQFMLATHTNTPGLCTKLQVTLVTHSLMLNRTAAPKVCDVTFLPPFLISI